MKYERGSFITVASRDTLRGLHPTAQCLYMWLSSYANETGNCFPSRKTLADDCGCSEDTVDKMLRLLMEFGLVTKQNRIEKGEKLSNLYTVLVVRGSRQNRLPYPPTTATLAARNGINSNQLTQPIEGGVAIAPPIVVFEREEEAERVPKSKAKYADARVAFSWLPNRQLSWDEDLTQLKCGLLLFKRGEEAVRKFVKYVQYHSEDEGWNYVFVKPSDYERKWEDIKAYAKRNS